MIPIFILQIWLLGLFSVALLGAAVYLGNEWQRQSWAWDPVYQESYFAPDFGANAPTAMLAGAVAILLLSLFGGTLVRWVLKLTKTRAEQMDPRTPVDPASQQDLELPDGSRVHVEFFGPEDGLPVILSHGWGMHGAAWNYCKRELGSRLRLIVWDEPGLGESKRPANRDYSLENLARKLEAVVRLAGEQPVVLLGHSIGGMITLTFCRLFPEALGTRVHGLVLTHTTPQNPVRTTSGAAFFSAIENPILRPLMYLTIGLSPLVWLMQWLSYRNGSAHLATMQSSYGGTESWQQIDFATSFQPQASPAVLARGMLGMMRYDARAVLPEIPVPALIVAGDRDSTTKPEASELMRAGIPDSRLRILTPAKHLGHIEHHVEYAAAVREFVHEVHAHSAKTAA